MKELKNNAASEYLRVTGEICKRYKSLGDKTFEQIDDKDFYYRTDEDSNSILVFLATVKHFY